MHTLFLPFIDDQSGVTAIEYGLIAALIAVAIIRRRDHGRHRPHGYIHVNRHRFSGGGMTLLGSTIRGTFTAIANALS
jgi:Flp pilus assembly pilin Flp